MVALVAHQPVHDCGSGPNAKGFLHVIQHFPIQFRIHFFKASLSNLPLLGKLASTPVLRVSKQLGLVFIHKLVVNTVVEVLVVAPFILAVRCLGLLRKLDWGSTRKELF